MVSLNEELRSSISNHQTLQNQLSSTTTQLEQAKSDLVDKTQQLTQQAAEMELLQTRINTADCELSEREEILEARSRASTLEIEQLKANIRELNETNDFVRHKSEQLEQEIEHLKQVKSQNEKIIDEIEQSRDKFIAELNQIKLDLETERAQIPDLETKLADSEAKRTELEKTLSESQKGSAERMSQQTDHVAKLSGELTELTAIKMQLINDNEKLLDELEKSHRESDDLSTKLNDTQRAFEEHRRHHAELHCEHEKLLEDQIGKIEQLQEVSNSWEETANKLELSETKVNMLEQANEQLRHQLIEYGELRHKYNEADNELNTLIVIKSELQEKVDHLTAENYQLKTSMRTTSEQLATHERSANQKASLIEGFEKQFKDLTAKYSMSEGKLDKAETERAEVQQSLQEMQDLKEPRILEHTHFFESFSDFFRFIWNHTKEVVEHELNYGLGHN